jgi:mercuric reductase
MADRVQITLDIQGMTCDGCASHVENALRGIAGVEAAAASSWRTARATLVAVPDLPDEVLRRTTS